MIRAVTVWASLLALAAGPSAAKPAADDFIFAQGVELCLKTHGAPAPTFEAAARASWGDEDAQYEASAGIAHRPGEQLLTHASRTKMFGHQKVLLAAEVRKGAAAEGAAAANICSIYAEGMDSAPVLSAARAYFKVRPSSAVGPGLVWVFKDAINPANVIPDDASLQAELVRSGHKIILIFVSGFKDKAGLQYREWPARPDE